MINSGDVSVVIQGPYAAEVSAFGPHPITRAAILAARRALPDAQLIFSTWPGDLPELPVDVSVKSEDPGPGRMRLKDRVQTTNFNRLIRSSQAGLARADRPYTLKMRSDLLLNDAGFLSYFDRFPKRDPNEIVFTERVIVSQFLTRAPHRPGRFAVAHHPSDWLQFGRTEDVRALYDLPLIDDETAFVNAHPELAARGIAPWRMPPENYIWLETLKRHGRAFDYDWSKLTTSRRAARADQAASNRLLVNNFIVLGPRELAVRNMKFGNFEYTTKQVDLASTLSHVDWLRLYRAYCDATAMAPRIDRYHVRRRVMAPLREVSQKTGLVHLRRAFYKLKAARNRRLANDV